MNNLSDIRNSSYFRQCFSSTSHSNLHEDSKTQIFSLSTNDIYPNKPSFSRTKRKELITVIVQLNQLNDNKDAIKSLFVFEEPRKRSRLHTRFFLTKTHALVRNVTP